MEECCVQISRKLEITLKGNKVQIPDELVAQDLECIF